MPFSVILGGIELLPNAGREDVLVPLVPPPINHFRQARICTVTFQLRVQRCCRAAVTLFRRPRQRVVYAQVWGRRGRGRARRR